MLRADWASRGGLPRRLTCAALLCATLAGCGPGMAERAAEQARQRERLERGAFRFLAPESAEVAAGSVLDVALQIRVTEGFYVPVGTDAGDLAGLRVEPPRISFARVTHIAMPQDAKLVELPGHPEARLCYDGDRTIGVRLDVARTAPPGRRMLTFEVVYQLCSVRGCSVPQRASARTFVDITAPRGGSVDDLAP